MKPAMLSLLAPIDRRIMRATQAGLPLVPAPYAEIARWLELTEAEVIERMKVMQAHGVIRSIGLIPDHQALGTGASGMSVWGVDASRVAALCNAIRALPLVTYCALRRPASPEWPYNLFAMLHGRSREEVEAGHAQIGQLLGDAGKAGDILHATRPQEAPRRDRS